MAPSAEQHPSAGADDRLESSPPLQAEHVAFTGTLASMTHREALRRVEECGGTPTHSVSRQTTMLVVGEEGWPLEPDGRPSQKLCQVLQWNQEGGNCRILREAEWLHLIGLDQRRRDIHAEYTPAMLSRLLDVPVQRIRRWHRIGLLHAVRTVGRLPLFDYQEVTGARRIVQLLKGGVGELPLQRGLNKLRSILRSETATLSQLPVELHHARLLYRDAHGLKDPLTGQRWLRFDVSPDSDLPQRAAAEDVASSETGVIRFAEAAASLAPRQRESAQWNADDWFREGYRLLEQNELDLAARAFHRVLMDLPGNPEANFYLAEALYRSGNNRGALERYAAAVEADHHYLEAWIQLGCVHSELDETDSALEALETALQIHPENPDAHWHIADVLWRIGKNTESRGHWEFYLQYDAQGPWAETARQRLQELGAASFEEDGSVETGSSD